MVDFIDNLGKLCHRHDTEAVSPGALCHRHDTEAASPGALVFRGGLDPAFLSGVTEISCTFEPLTWICETYNATHPGTLVFSSGWDLRTRRAVGAFVTLVEESYTTGTTSIYFDIRADEDLCMAHELPKTLTGAVSVTKDDVTKTVVPFTWHPTEANNPTWRITISFVNGVLSSAQAQEVVQS